MGGKQSKDSDFGFPKVKTWSSGLHLNLNLSKENVSTNSSTFTRKKSDSLRAKTRWPVPHVDAAFLPEYRIFPGKELENYEVLGVIAAGAYGNVLKGVKLDEKRLCAIKLINKSRVLIEGSGSVQQCKDEVSIQEHVKNYPFTVELIQFWQTRKRLYLVLEYIPNGELFSVWRMLGAMSESLARFYIGEIALTIEYLHRNDIVYRDLKMENILLDSQGHVKIVDFGLAKWLNSGRRTRTICGTLQYTAPEMLSGQPYTHTVDWWSLGVLSFALLTGRFPLFGAKDHLQMREMVRQHHYPIPQALSNEAAGTLREFLQKDPYRRLRGIAAIQNSPFFNGDISLVKLEQKQYNPSNFFTNEDLMRINPNTPIGLWLSHSRSDFQMLHSDSDGKPFQSRREELPIFTAPSNPVAERTQPFAGPPRDTNGFINTGRKSRLLSETEEDLPNRPHSKQTYPYPMTKSRSMASGEMSALKCNDLKHSPTVPLNLDDGFAAF